MLNTTIEKFNYNIETIVKNRKELYDLRQQFIDYYNIDHIQKMDINEYVVGVPRLNNGLNFCNTLERDLLQLGNINGSTAYKFGIYYGRTRLDPERTYRYTRLFGSNYEEAFESIKNEIFSLLSNSEAGELDKIVNCRLSPMFKSKIMNTYFYDRYLNIHSDNHLNYYLTKLNIEFEITENPIFKREKLLEFKSKHKIMAEWTIDMFGYFLWDRYPGAPNILN